MRQIFEWSYSDLDLDLDFNLNPNFAFDFDFDLDLNPNFDSDLDHYQVLILILNLTGEFCCFKILTPYIVKRTSSLRCISLYIYKYYPNWLMCIMRFFTLSVFLTSGKSHLTLVCLHFILNVFTFPEFLCAFLTFF